MESVPKLIRHFVGILFLSFFLLIALNVFLWAMFTTNQASNGSPWTTAEQVAKGLKKAGGKDTEGYVLTDRLTLELESSDIWAILIDEDTRQVIWQTDDLPAQIPLSYSICDIADLTRGYIDGYPTFTGKRADGLIVLGYPKKSFWKHMWPSWDYDLIAHLPWTILKILLINLAIILLIYTIANTKLLKSVKPITRGIQELPLGKPVHLKETGMLSEIAVNINRTSDILQSQKHQLRQKETARANWIAGVSHDIRTPLSMVMGYAGQLKEDGHLTDDQRQKATVIVKQSERMKNLINNLNLASKLEYNMQPVNLARVNMIAIVRQVAVDFINMDIDDKHPIEWETDEGFLSCPVNADKDLIKRAVSNLIQNSIRHNGQGCKIHIGVTAGNGKCIVEVSDDGMGATDKQLEKLNHAPHYMVCDRNSMETRHGLGLLIVKQIAASHGGTIEMAHSPYGGLSVKIILPYDEKR